MNPYNIYGEHALLIASDGDCWHWLGDIRKIGESSVPAWLDGKRWRNVLRGGLVTAEVLANDSQTYYQACDTSWCMNPDHYSGPGTEIAVMVAIRDRSWVDDDCLMWEGQVNPGGSPVIQVPFNGKSRRISVRKFVYEVEHNVTLPEGELVRVVCGRKKCVSHKHVTLRPHTVRHAESASDCDPVTEARRECARLFMLTANENLLKEYA